MKAQLSIITGLLLLLIGSDSIASTWRVEQDGSGDWLTIQPAVDAAATGDTILIGPGRYDQLHAAPLASTAIAIWDTPKSLVFIGSDVDSVVVGPTEYVHNSYGLWFRDYAAQIFHNITFNNLHHGISTADDLVVDGCKFIECKGGVNSSGVAGVSMASVTNCIFQGRDWAFTSYAMNMRNFVFVLVENCEIRDMELYLQGMDDSLVKNCKFPHTMYGVAIANISSNGTIENNEVSGLIAISGLSNVMLRNNTVFTALSQRNLMIEDKRSTVQAFGNIFYGGTETTIGLAYNSSFSGSGNHFLKGPGPDVVHLWWYDGSVPSTIDLRDNYWGSSDAEEIASWIYDSNDDPTIHGTVMFQPFSSVPLPVEGQEKSFGGFKAMFR